MHTIQHVAVLGAGTMGSRIAAHFANAGISVLLLDLATEGADRNAVAKRGLEVALGQRPEAFFVPSNAGLVQPGNFNDDLPKIASCEWVIEAVTEDLSIKREIWARAVQNAGPDAVLSTNTSGIRLAEIARDFPPHVLPRFLGTHFFNPPRYLHLLEVIPGPGTDPALLGFVTRFAERRLGKGVVRCKDTPNFIANRIGSFLGAAVYRATVEFDMSVEEVDALTGPLMGIPKSATYRLLDIVGLDVWELVSRNLFMAATDDPWRDWFTAPDFMQRMVAQGLLGEKRGQGFYKRVGPEKQIHAIDWKTLEYRPARKVVFESVEATKPIADLGKRLRALVSQDARVGHFLWAVLSNSFRYSAAMTGVIADRVVEIDRAMRWGYGHQFGPFELWDAMGFREIAERMANEHGAIPESVRRMLESGAQSFYRPADEEGQPRTEYFDLSVDGGYRVMEERPAVIDLAQVKRARGRLDGNSGASLLDLGDGVLCLEFHSKMNAIGQDALEVVNRSADLLESKYEAMVIANQGENFSVGANLVLLLMAAQEGDFDAINQMIYTFQQAMLRLKYAARPVVAAAFSRALGGGCEVVLQSHRVQASAELYIGLVEAGVGLIPAAGGCKESVLRFANPMKAFETIGQAKVSTSADDARRLGFLREVDRISMNPEFLIDDAKQYALSLAQDYRRGQPRTDIAVGGEPGYAAMRLAAWSLLESGMISNHDFTIAEKLANVLSGGRVTAGTLVSEQYLLDLEREAFLSLTGMPKSQERIQYMLKNGKPLRN